tara:strand:- start:128997 stop:129266 length:270 start_codon:yes stop_codon:yes gene_type:complete
MVSVLILYFNLEENTEFISYSAVPDQEAILVDAGVICFDENDESFGKRNGLLRIMNYHWLWPIIKMSFMLLLRQMKLVYLWIMKYQFIN